LTQLFIYTGTAFIIGFSLCLVIHTFTVLKIKKALRSTQGYLESEILKKETLQKENVQVHQLKQAIEIDCVKKLEDASKINKTLDGDILLLQKSNEDTEALLLASQPALYALKLQLIEANNLIARYKALQQPVTKV